MRTLLGNGDKVVATFVMIPRVEVIEMLAATGFDAVIIDLEHGPIAMSRLPELAAFARAAGVHSIARVAEANPTAIAAVLDAGLDGVMVPHMSSSSSAAEIVSASRFPPDGHRSLNPYVRGAAYDATAPGRLASFNDHPCVIGMLEGRDALGDLDAILKTPGLDGVFVGPVDLSGELGYPGQPEHPEVLAVVRDVFARCADAGVASGVYAPTADRANSWFQQGASLVAVSADAAMILNSFRSVRDRVTVSRDVGQSDR